MAQKNPYIEHWGGESSVDFCESNFTLHPQIAEPFNTISAFPLIALGLLGCMRLSQTRKGGYVLLFSLLTAVGVGTVTLHGTLSAYGQAVDEVPMLLLTIGMLASLAEARGFIPYGRVLIALTSIVSIAVMIWYFYFQQIYIVFIISYSLMVATIVFHLGYLSFHQRESPEHDRSRTQLIKPLFLYGIASYLGFGLVAWTTDMLLCDTVSQFVFGGLLLHPLWHLGAALGSWCAIFAILAAREEFHGHPPPNLTWLCAGLLPCITPVSS